MRLCRSDTQYEDDNGENVCKRECCIDGSEEGIRQDRLEALRLVINMYRVGGVTKRSESYLW